MRVLLVDDERRVGEGMRRRLRRLHADWDVQLASGADQAIENMSAAPADAIVSDLCMPGRDGAELFEEIEENFPSSFRIALTGHADHSLALRATAHAHRLVTKPCEAGDIASIVVEGVHLLKRLEDQSLRRFVSSVGQLPKPTEKLQAVLNKVRDPDADLSDFQGILESEPVLAAGIMRIANTAFFGGGNISSLLEAVQGLGLSIVQAILVGEMARRSVNIPHSCAPILERIVSGSQESLDCCLRLHRDFYRKECDRGGAITACLLQDIGKLIFLSCRPLVYRDVVGECERTHGDITEIERQRFGCDHAQVGALLLNLWGLPESIVAAVALHHQSEFVSANPISLPGLLFLGGQTPLNRSAKPDYFFMKKEEGSDIENWVPQMAQSIGVTAA